MRRVLLAITLTVLHTFTWARDVGACSPMEMSTAEANVCLSKLLKVEEAVLAKTLSEFRTGIKGFTFTSDREKNAAVQKDFLRSLDSAHSTWKSLVQIECADLLSGGTYGGNGIANAELECKIARTRDRALEIEDSEPYQWILPRQAVNKSPR